MGFPVILGVQPQRHLLERRGALLSEAEWEGRKQEKMETFKDNPESASLPVKRERGTLEVPGRELEASGGSLIKTVRGMEERSN